MTALTPDCNYRTVITDKEITVSCLPMFDLHMTEEQAAQIDDLVSQTMQVAISAAFASVIKRVPPSLYVESQMEWQRYMRSVLDDPKVRRKQLERVRLVRRSGWLQDGEKPLSAAEKRRLKRLDAWVQTLPISPTRSQEEAGDIIHRAADLLVSKLAVDKLAVKG